MWPMVGFGINFKGIKFTSDVYMHSAYTFTVHVSNKSKKKICEY